MKLDHTFAGRLQFLDMYPKVINDTSLEKWIFNVRAHTTEIQSCLLTSLPLEKNSNKEVNCTLTGDPPDLSLIVVLDKESDAKGENWALSLRNDIGFSDTLVFTTHFRKYSSTFSDKYSRQPTIGRTQLGWFL